MSLNGLGQILQAEEENLRRDGYTDRQINRIIDFQLSGIALSVGRGSVSKDINRVKRSLDNLNEGNTNENT